MCSSNNLLIINHQHGECSATPGIYADPCHLHNCCMIIFALLLFIWTFLQEARSLSDYTEMLQKFQKTRWKKKLWDRSASCFDIFYTCTSAAARLFHLKDQDKCWRSDVTAGTRRINKRWLGFTDATLKSGLYLVTNTDNWSTLEGRAHVLVHCNVNSYSVLETN